MTTSPAAVRIREVGPRDGLQGEAPVSPPERAALVDRLADAGLADVEAVAFVSPRAVPAMAGAAEVMKAVRRRPGLRLWALVPNRRGAEMALESGADGLTVTLSASEEYSERNVGMPVEGSLRELEGVAALAGGAVPVDAVISCAFGSPYEGGIGPAEVAALGRRALDAGAGMLTFADTTGMARPGDLRRLLAEVGTDVGLHLHATRGTALVNAYAAWQMGVERFDTSIGGLGGSPFATGAGGNLATEELVYLLEDAGVATGVDLERALLAAAGAERAVGHGLRSRLAVAGLAGTAGREGGARAAGSPESPDAGGRRAVV